MSTEARERGADNMALQCKLIIACICFSNVFEVLYVEDLAQVVIAYEIYETGLYAMTGYVKFIRLFKMGFGHLQSEHFFSKKMH